VTVEKRDQGENVEIRSLEEELFWIQMLIGVVFFIIINYYCFFFLFVRKSHGERSIGGTVKENSFDSKTPLSFDKLAN
jgi:hypothetical protein